MGHLGATGGSLTAPTGPLVDLADDVTSVDLVIGDHTDQQVLATRPNGMLVTENRSKGLRFTRIRLVLTPGKDGIAYMTADFHKPWTIGLTPDAAIQAKIDAPERATPADPRHEGRRGQRGGAAQRRLRGDSAGRDGTNGRACLRVARRERGHGRDAPAVRH